MDIKELLARFKGFQKAVLALLAALLVLNTVALAWVLSRISDLENRPVHVSSPSVSISDPSPRDGLLSADLKADTTMAAQGVSGVLFTFRLVSKIPGSRVLLAYRLNDAPEWLEASTQPVYDDPLEFRASLALDVNNKISYRLQQRVNGEIVHASTLRTADMASLVGNGDVYLNFLPASDPKTAVLCFSQLPFHKSKLESLQIAEMKLKINGSRVQEVVLKGTESGEMTHTVALDGLKNVEVTVVYKDGQTRAAVYDPNKRPEGPFVKR